MNITFEGRISDVEVVVEEGRVLLRSTLRAAPADDRHGIHRHLVDFVEQEHGFMVPASSSSG